jgi:hypothetical protein
MESQPKPISYPYTNDALRPAWADRRSQLLAALSVCVGFVALWLRAPLQLQAFDGLVLRVVFPTMLGFVLAFAPAPRTHVGRIARVLTIIALALSPFTGDWLPLLLGCYPLLLMAAVVLGRERDVRSAPGAAHE